MKEQLEEYIRDKKGRFSERNNPPSKPIQVYLPEPLIRSLDEFGKKNGTGRGKSLISLLEGVLDAPPEAITPVGTFRASHYLRAMAIWGVYYQLKKD